jgi:hypothetical protein
MGTTRRPRAVSWDEDKTKFRSSLLVDGQTYNGHAYAIFDTPPLLEHSLSTQSLQEHADRFEASPQRGMYYCNRILPAGCGLRIYAGDSPSGRVFFTTDVILPTLFAYDAASYSPLNVWMSVTPMEVLSQRPAVRGARGHVLIGGLGLGWLLRKVAAKRCVSKITLVEISEDLLQWYGYRLCEEITQSTGTPITVICDDVTDHIGSHGNDVRYLVDIWCDYGTDFHDLSQRMRRNICKAQYFWGWGLRNAPVINNLV